MKKQIVRLTFILVLVLSLAVCSIAFFGCGETESSGGGTSGSGKITCTADKNGGKVDVTVNLVKNPGYSNLLLTLDYDDEVLTFTGYDLGTALASMNMLPTGSITITPFKFLYGPINGKDTSTGKMMTLHFRVKTSAPSGTTYVGFIYKKNSGVYRAEEKGNIYLNPEITYAKVTV